MSIDQIKYFYNIAKLKSITKVAKDSHISQSALSQQMQKFENSIGYKLFDTSNKGVELTEMGEIVYKYSESIIDIYSKMLDELNHKANNMQVIRIEACCSLDDYFLTNVLCNTGLDLKNITCKLYGEKPQLIIDHVKNGLCDVGFICDQYNDKDHICKEVGKIEFILFASPDYPIPEKIELNYLPSYPIITMNEKFEFRWKLMKNLNSVGFDSRKLNITLELGSFEAIKKSVEASKGIAFLPDIAVSEDIAKGTFKKISISNTQLMQTFNILYKRLPVNTALQKLVDYFDEIDK